MGRGFWFVGEGRVVEGVDQVPLDPVEVLTKYS